MVGFFLVSHVFLYVYHRKFDQCYFPSSNLSIAIERHLFNFNNPSIFKGRGHQIRKPFKLEKSEHEPTFNVLFIIAESYRKDKLSCYNKERILTPNFEQFRNGNIGNFVCFGQVFSASSSTMLAVPAILSGISPHQGKDMLYKQPLLSSVAKSENFYTFMVSSHTMQWYRFYNFYKNENFDFFWSKEESRKPFFNDLGIDDKYTINQCVNQIKQSKKPFFGIIQLNGTHYPYNVPNSFKKYTNNFEDSYDNSVLYMDHQMKQLYELLNEQKLKENTLVVFISDHAETLKEHNGIGHVDNYYIETLNIPCWIRLPNKLKNKDEIFNKLIKNKRTNLVSSDIYPTIIDLIVKNKKNKEQLTLNLNSKSLLEQIDKKRKIISMNNNELTSFKIGISVIQDSLHYIKKVNILPYREELYNFKKDPLEKNNLYSKKLRSKLIKDIIHYPLIKKYVYKYQN